MHGYAIELFITSNPFKGLGATPEQAERMISDDADTLVMHWETCKNPRSNRIEYDPTPCLSATRSCRAGEFGNWIAFGEDRISPTCKALKTELHVVESEVAKNCRQEIVGSHLARNGVFTARVGSTDHLSRLNSTSSEQHCVGTWPVIAARLDRSLSERWPLRHRYSRHGRCAGCVRTRPSRRPSPACRVPGRRCLRSTRKSLDRKNGARYVLASKTWWLTAWSSQLATRPHSGPSNSVATMSTPASTSRRAIRHCCPHRLRPYSVAEFVGSPGRGRMLWPLRDWPAAAELVHQSCRRRASGRSGRCPGACDQFCVSVRCVL